MRNSLCEALYPTLRLHEKAVGLRLGGWSCRIHVWQAFSFLSSPTDFLVFVPITTTAAQNYVAALAVAAAINSLSLLNRTF